jgi:site-specific recombinase XerD
MNPVLSKTGGYLLRKGLLKGKNPKAESDTFLSVEDVNKILLTIKQSDHPMKERDHCALFMGFYFGLRVSEAAIIERNCFRHIDKGQIYVRRSKSVPRIAVECSGCKRKFNISAKKSGQEHDCVRCGRPMKVIAKKTIDMTPPEKSVPVVETRVSEYIKEYMVKHVRPGQRWFFEGSYAQGTPLEDIPHIGTRQMANIFSHWVVAAGLSPIYSWHALRHARGMFLYERFNDLSMVQKMLGHKSIASTQIYVHMSPRRKAAYRESLDSVFETL